jgi:hypothetical protein
MVAPLIPLALGAVARVAGPRMAASAVSSGGSPAAGQAMQFGGRALQMSAMARQPKQQQPQAQPGRVRQAGRQVGTWAKHNPGEAAFAAAAIVGGPRPLQNASNQFDTVMQSGQFNTIQQ